MSLLTDDKAQVVEAQNFVMQGGGGASAATTTNTATAVSGVTLKTVVGYVTPTNQEYTFVLDLQTKQPLQLPEGFLPITLFTVPLQQYETNNVLIYASFVDSSTNPANVREVDNWSGNQLNSVYTYTEINDIQNNALYYQGYNWLAFRNYYYPTPITSGISKIVLQYI